MTIADPSALIELLQGEIEEIKKGKSAQEKTIFKMIGEINELLDRLKLTQESGYMDHIRLPKTVDGDEWVCCYVLTHGAYTCDCGADEHNANVLKASEGKVGG